MAAVDGDWDVTVKSPMGDQKSVLTINSDGDSFTGKMAGQPGFDGHCQWQRRAATRSAGRWT
jgi:hypothetical protein